jgi:large subunit ribosomal protein L29
MKVEDARQLSDDQLNGEIADLRRKLFGLRSQTVTEKVEDNSQFGKIRKDIARLLTVRTDRRAKGKK